MSFRKKKRYTRHFQVIYYSSCKRKVSNADAKLYNAFKIHIIQIKYTLQVKNHSIQIKKNIQYK